MVPRGSSKGYTIRRANIRTSICPWLRFSHPLRRRKSWASASSDLILFQRSGGEPFNIFLSKQQYSKFHQVDIVLSPSAAYSVDILLSRSAEVMACSKYVHDSYVADSVFFNPENSGFRSFLMAFATAGIMPMINTYGFLTTTTLGAIMAWIGFGYVQFLSSH